MEKLASVLLVDDDSTNNFLNELLFTQFSVTDRLLTAADGAQALELIQGLASPDEPSLILLDVNMPGMGGIAFLEAYRRRSAVERGSTVILMLTTTMDASDLSRLDELHIDGLVSKPLTEEKLKGILQLHFHRTLPSR